MSFYPAAKKCNAIILVAACAYSTLATGQNTPQNTALAEQCVSPWQFAEITPTQAGSQTDAYGKTSVALGSYERISPDGRFVLRSFSGGRLGEVSLIELSATGQVVKVYETPLSNEAFPVQGTWRYLVNVNGDHYTFSSLLRNGGAGKKAFLPLFNGGMTGFYAAAAELPSSKPGHVRIRSLSWPNPSGNSDTQGEGALVSRTLEVDTTQHKITSDSGNTSLCTQRLRQDGPLYALPMISVDGQEFAALPQNPPPASATQPQGQPTMRIFGFGESGKACESRATFSFNSGKTIFGFGPQAANSFYSPQAANPIFGSGTANPIYPVKTSAAVDVTANAPKHDQQEQGADLAYEYRGQVWWHHRGAGVGGAAGGQAFNIAPYFDNTATQLLASAFPGITQDGRVIYAATLKDCGNDATGKQCTQRSGYVITDPFQSNAWQAFLRQHKGPARRQCITQGDVAQSRAAFAKFHGIAP